jgi:hypothetical protein
MKMELLSAYKHKTTPTRTVSGRWGSGDGSAIQKDRQRHDDSKELDNIIERTRQDYKTKQDTREWTRR